jgi:Divergent InlB B-repeat domain
VAGPPQQRVEASGDQAVAIGGDATNAVIVTGSNVNLTVRQTVAGARLSLLRRKPKVRLRAPLDVRLGRFPNHLDRESESEALLAALAGIGAVNLYGEGGVGKTYVLASVLDGAAAPRDGVLYVDARGELLEDVLQRLFEEFFDCRPPFKAGGRQLREGLAQREALVALDFLSLDASETQQLALALPRSRLLLVSRERGLFDGRPIYLRGLATADALGVVEQELGRPLTDGERPAAAAVSERLGGHPQRIRGAVALVREGRATLDELADPDEDLGRRQLDALSPDERRLVAGLDAVRPASLGVERLRELTGDDDAAARLADLERRGVVGSHSPHYSLAGHLGAEVAESDGLVELLGYFVEWARRTRDDPQAQLEEAGVILQLARAGRRVAPSLVVELVQAADGAFATGRRWGAWAALLGAALEAARAAGNVGAEAWALHQLGTRSFAVGNRAEARTTLERALELREAIGDREGAAATKANLALVRRPPWLLRQIGQLPFVALPVVLVALLLASGGTGAYLWGDGDGDGDGGRGGGASTGSTDREPVALRVAVVGEGEGTVTSTPRAIACPGACTSTFPAGSDVTLVAEARRGSAFAGWDGACSGLGPCVVALAESASVEATFRRADPRVLEVRLEGRGEVAGVPGGISCPPDCREAYPPGTSVTLTAAAAAGWTFAGWSGAPDCSDPKRPCTVTLAEGETVTARFAEAPAGRTLEVVTGDGGSVTSTPAGIACGSVCSSSFDDGTEVVLIPTPATGFRFESWGGDCEGSGECRLTMDGAKSVTASFAATGGTAQLTVAISGEGFVTSDPQALNCEPACSAPFPTGDVVTLSASPSKGWAFAGWRGAEGCGSEPTCEVTVEAPVAVTAGFKPLVGLTVRRTGDGTGTVAGGGIDCGATCATSVPAGATVVLTAEPDPGSDFFGWSGGGCGGTETCEVDVDVATEVTADFRARRRLTVTVFGGVGTVTSEAYDIACSLAEKECRFDLRAGSVVTLTAESGPDSYFVGWTAPCFRTRRVTTTCTVSMSEAQTVGAQFNANVR